MNQQDDQDPNGQSRFLSDLIDRFSTKGPAPQQEQPQAQGAVPLAAAYGTPMPTVAPTPAMSPTAQPTPQPYDQKMALSEFANKFANAQPTPQPTPQVDPGFLQGLWQRIRGQSTQDEK